MKTPIHPEHVIEALRQRLKTGDLTLGKAEVKRIAAMLETLSRRCSEAYQVVGSLAGSAGLMDNPAVLRALDLLNAPLRRGEILPFTTRQQGDAARKRRSDAKIKPTAKAARKKVRS